MLNDLFLEGAGTKRCAHPTAGLLRVAPCHGWGRWGVDPYLKFAMVRAAIGEFAEVGGSGFG
jgi:hypothetical protein